MNVLILLSITLISTVTAGGVFRAPICMELEEPLTMTINGPQRIKLQGKIIGNSGLNIQLVDGGQNICSKDIYQSCNILLHFYTRFNANQIVRNTYVLNDTKICHGSPSCKKGWGPEELSGGLPIQQGVTFEIVIICESNYFQIYIDNKHFASYEYRIPLDKATHLVLRGELAFKVVDITGSQDWSDQCSPIAERCTTINHIKIN